MSKMRIGSKAHRKWLAQLEVGDTVEIKEGGYIPNPE